MVAATKAPSDSGHPINLACISDICGSVHCKSLQIVLGVAIERGWARLFGFTLV
jgi:hypothetical protein